jgi:hypothetical protein
MTKLFALTAFTFLLAACGKSDAPAPQTNTAPAAKDEPSAQASAAKTVEAWAEPAKLCEHTVAVCDEEEKCHLQKVKLNQSGLRAYHLFDVDCVKWVTKRQTVLAAGYPACAACLRDAKSPQAVQDCMFAGGLCHGDAPK